MKPNAGRRPFTASTIFEAVMVASPVAIADGLSRPGDYVELRAETDVIAVLSNCPQTRNPCNGYNPTPIRVVVWRHSEPV